MGRLQGCDFAAINHKTVGLYCGHEISKKSLMNLAPRRLTNKQTSWDVCFVPILEVNVLPLLSWKARNAPRRALTLATKDARQIDSALSFLFHTRRRLLANAPIAPSRVSAYPRAALARPT